jgi:hypothetical protein
VSCGLRDVLELETLDTPAVLVASDAFVQAAHDQSRRLGQPAIRRTFVAHPVQDRTDDEVRAFARGVVDDVLARLGQAPPPHR